MNNLKNGVVHKTHKKAEKVVEEIDRLESQAEQNAFVLNLLSASDIDVDEEALMFLAYSPAFAGVDSTKKDLFVTRGHEKLRKNTNKLRTARMD